MVRTWRQKRDSSGAKPGFIPDATHTPPLTGSSHGRIDGSDLFVLARAFGACTGDAAYDARVDLNPDDCVDGTDLAIMASVWGLVLP